MRGYLTVRDTDAKVPVDSRIELYRDPDESHRVYAKKGDRTHNLGLSDGTVSRLKNGTPPVVIEPRESHIEIHNKRNTNGVTVEYKQRDGRTELDRGQVETIEETARIEIGYRAVLRIQVKRAKKEEYTFEGPVEGPVVMGDQTKIDERSQVVDSVVNRSQVGGEPGGEGGSGSVEDSTVNRSQVGGRPDGDDTQRHCERHDRMYTGEMCPECRSGSAKTGTKFCIHCGAEIPISATVCPDCDERLSGGSR